MPLIVPDESLCTVAEAAAYHLSRGNGAEWDAIADERHEHLLRQAYDYLFDTYASLWPAAYEFGTVDDLGTIPPKVKYACAILALYAKDEPLSAPPSTAAQVVEKTVGPLTTKYAQQDAPKARTFPDVARMVAPYLVAAPSPYMATLIRN